jgi:hypothetical protein
VKITDNAEDINNITYYFNDWFWFKTKCSLSNGHFLFLYNLEKIKTVVTVERRFLWENLMMMLLFRFLESQAY